MIYLELYKTFSKIKTINGIIKINPLLEMEEIQLSSVLFINIGTFLISKYLSTWCGYNIIAVFLSGPNLLLFKIP